MPEPTPQVKQQVRAFWDGQPCGTGEPQAPSGSRGFFDQLGSLRYQREPMIHDFAEFSRRAGRRVLEIGCGAGSDSAQWAKGGARLTAVDLSFNSLQMTRRHLAVNRLEAQLCEADTECLPLRDDVFDLVYSWGVIHHTPDMPRAIAEIWRVLRPGGQIRIMIYHRYSWVALRTWAKHALLKGRPWHSFSVMLAQHMESAGTQAFTCREAHQLFSRFTNLRITTALTSYDTEFFGANMQRWSPLWSRLTRLTGHRFGWFLMVSGDKPTDS